MEAHIQQHVTNLNSADPTMRRQAVEALMELGEDAQPAAIALCAASGDVDEVVRESATAALEGLGGPQPGDLPALATLLKSDSADPAYWAATLLGRAGADAAGQTMDLASALTAHPAIPVRQRCAWALARLGNSASSALSALQQAAQSDDARLARLAQDAIGKVQAG